eukprot:a280_872.p1 GENE.a280_872~~a280_872.p1  ORF type:complete len:431 (+),score=208.06 a280_872:60-1295(+)
MSGKREKKDKSDRRARDAQEAAGSGSDDDAASVLTTMDAIPDTVEGAEEMFRAALEAVSEKRRETRVAGLRKVSSFLAHRVSNDLLAGTVETLATYLAASLKKGDAEEQRCACRAASVLFVTLGVDGGPIYRELAEALERVIATSSADATAGAAIASLALGTYVCCDDEPRTQAVFERMRAVYAGESPATGKTTVTSALFARALLMTLQPAREFLESGFFTEIEELQALLDADSADVRIAAGHNIALLFDMVAEETDAGAEIANVLEDIDLDGLTEAIGELAALSSRYMARSARIEQKDFFRELKRVVEERARPEVSITVGSARFLFRSWAQLTAFEAIKAALAGGLNAHFAENSLLRDMFPSLELDNARLSNAQKRAVKSPNSPQARARDQGRGSARDRKAAERAGGHDD